MPVQVDTRQLRWLNVKVGTDGKLEGRRALALPVRPNVCQDTDVILAQLASMMQVGGVSQDGSARRRFDDSSNDSPVAYLGWSNIWATQSDVIADKDSSPS